MARLKEIPSGNKNKTVHQSLKSSYYCHHIQLKIGDLSLYPLKQLRQATHNLIKGKGVQQGLSNRAWFTKTFIGGMYETAVEQTEHGDGFSYYIDLECFNTQPHLSPEIKQSLTQRFQQLFPTGEVFFAQGNPRLITDTFEIATIITNLMLTPTLVYTESEAFKRLGSDFSEFVEQVAAEEGEGFGQILQLVRNMKKASLKYN
jgi:hypothetical protein